MDRVLVGLGFAKCYIDDSFVFSPISKDQGHHMQEVFGRLKDHNLKFHLGKYIGGIPRSHDLSKWIGGTKGQG
jgi:hypothetical protein